MGQRVILTGASGLLGRHVFSHWDEAVGELVVPGTSAPRVDLLRLGAVEELIETVQPAKVIHLAWIASGSADYRTSPENEIWVDRSIALTEICKARGVDLYLTGSAVDSRPGNDLYSSSKAALLEACRADLNAKRLGWIRPFYVFDSEARRPGLLRDALEAKRNGKPLTIRHPQSQHDFVHAGDVASGIVTAVRHRLLGEVEIGSGKLRSVVEFAEAVGATAIQDSNTPSAETYSHVERPADIEPLKALGWAPQLTERHFPQSDEK